MMTTVFGIRGSIPPGVSLHYPAGVPTKLAEFLVASTLIILAPGPSVLFTIARAVAWGRFVAIMTVIGNASGMLVMAALVAFGFGPLLEQSPLLYAIVQWAGGVYLIWLGIDALRHRHEHASDMLDQGTSVPSGGKTLREGFVVGLLNPKSLVFFAAVFPQFIDRDAGNVPLQMMLLGVIFAKFCICK